MKLSVSIMISFFLCIWLSTGCVSFKAQYSEDWKRQEVIDNPYFTLYLIGDAGNAAKGSNTEVFDHLKKELAQEAANSAIVWLGDNIYPVGLAPTQSVYHEDGRYKVMAQLNTMIGFQGFKFFVPGNHDWYTFGRIGLRRQELLVDSFLLTTPNPNQQSNFFYPDKGCGDPQVVELAEDISLLLMDSHWFLNDKARAGGQEVCAVKNTADFLHTFETLVEAQADNSLIVASHHPPYTYAHHGGKFPLKDDVFPLTQVVNWLYLPMPLNGFLFNRARLRISEQDVYHPLYKDYRAKMVEALNKKGKSIVASGHEHTLQFIENDNQYFIVSGAGTKNNKVGMGKGSEFAIGKQGYVKVLFQNPKNALVQYVVPGHFNNNDNIAFETVVELK